MPRPHTEFLKTAAMPWQEVPARWPRAGCRIKMLSADAESGACSVLILYPRSWSLDGDRVPSCDEELFVIDGDLVIGERCYGEGAYAYLPAGYPRETMRSDGGAVVLTFFEGAPVAAASRDYDRSQLIEMLDTNAMDWADPSDATLDRGRVRRKVLKHVAPDGGRTWLLKIDTADGRPFEINGIERHPCVEEMLLLEGDMAMTCGTMRAGDYFWRPPMIPHGPMGTRGGFFALFRAKEGRFSTEWSAPDVPISWDAPYRPILPPPGP